MGYGYLLICYDVYIGVLKSVNKSFYLLLLSDFKLPLLFSMATVVNCR
jgi:hypothetical protein